VGVDLTAIVEPVAVRVGVVRIRAERGIWLEFRKAARRR